MPSQKAKTIFNAALNSDTMFKKLTEITIDDRWQRGQERMNAEIADWAFQWAKSAFKYENEFRPSRNDAKTVIEIALLVLQWRK